MQSYYGKKERKLAIVAESFVQYNTFKLPFVQISLLLYYVIVILQLSAPQCAIANSKKKPIQVIGSSGIQVEDYKKIETETESLPQDIGNKRKEMVDKLIALMNDGNENAEIDAHYMLLNLTESFLVDYLIERLNKGNKLYAQLAILEAIAKVGSKDASKKLLFELDHGESESKEAVIRVMGLLGNEIMIPTLFDILAGKTIKRTPDMEKEAALALGNIGTEKAIYSLEAARARVSYDKTKLLKIIDWSLKKSKKTIDLYKTDDEIPKGQNARLSFKGMEYYFYRPPFDSERFGKPWLLVCIHDKQYDTEHTNKICNSIAEKNNVAVLVPVFDPLRFPHYENLNYRATRADNILLDLVDFLGQHSSIASREVFLWGSNEGGSFVQRFSYLHPERVAKAAFSSKELSKTDDQVYFPIGLRPSPFDPSIKFDTVKIAKLDIAYFSFSVSEANAASLPKRHSGHVDEFREFFRTQEFLPRITFFKDTIYSTSLVSEWFFKELDK